MVQYGVGLQHPTVSPVVCTSYPGKVEQIPGELSTNAYNVYEGGVFVVGRG